MTKFYQYINEIIVSNETTQAGEVLSKDCSEIINFYRKSSRVGHKKAIFRGTQKRISIISDKIRPRKNRKPTDTPIELQKKFDKEFNKQFGGKPRSSGVFTFGRGDILGYGNSYAVFPADGGSYLWASTIPDLFVALKRDRVIGNFGGIDVYYKENPDELDDYIKEKVSEYTDKKLNAAIGVMREIIINCDYYYLVEQNTGEGILDNYIKG